MAYIASQWPRFLSFAKNGEVEEGPAFWLLLLRSHPRAVCRWSQRPHALRLRCSKGVVMKKTYRIALCLFVLLPVVFSVGWGSGTAQLPDPPIPQTDVMRSRTTTILSSSVNPSKCGQAVTFTATVTSAGP